MAEIMAVRLLPVRGKYYETSLPQYGPQRIWKVLPGNEDKKIWGTPVPPDVAYALLMIRPDVVKLAPPTKGEKWESAFSNEQMENIKSKNLYGYPTVKPSVSEVPDVSEKASKAFKKEVDALKAENSELKSQIDKISANYEKLAAYITKTTPPASGAGADPAK
jgi:hypothetical protein